MPHIVVEHSANLAAATDIPALLARLRRAALETGQVQEEGLRIRALPAETYLVGNADPRNAFVHITVRIRPGRPAEVRSRMADMLHAAACESLQSAFDTIPLGLTLELQEIDIAFRRLHSSLAGHPATSPATTGATP